MIVPNVFEWLTVALVVAVLWIVGSFPVAWFVGSRLRRLNESYPEEVWDE